MIHIAIGTLAGGLAVALAWLRAGNRSCEAELRARLALERAVDEVAGPWLGQRIRGTAGEILEAASRSRQ
jgi:hypothetical protein